MRTAREPVNTRTHDTLESVFVDIRRVGGEEDLLSLEFHEEGRPRTTACIRLNLEEWEKYRARIEVTIERARREGCARG